MVVYRNVATEPGQSSLLAHALRHAPADAAYPAHARDAAGPGDAALLAAPPPPPYLGQYEASSETDAATVDETQGLPPVDPMRWTMVQDVMVALGGPIDEAELSEAAAPIAELGAAASDTAREAIQYDDPEPGPVTRFDGSTLPPDPIHLPKAAPKPVPGPSMPMVATGIIGAIVLLLGIWIAIDFLRAL